MSNMFGHQEPLLADDRPRYTRDLRPAIAEEKAVLMKRLGALIGRIPPVVANGGSINSVRQWKREREECAKIAGNGRSSVNQISSAIMKLEAWFK